MVNSARPGKWSLTERNCRKEKRLRWLHQARSRGTSFVESSKCSPREQFADFRVSSRSACQSGVTKAHRIRITANGNGCRRDIHQLEPLTLDYSLVEQLGNYSLQSMNPLRGPPLLMTRSVWIRGLPPFPQKQAERMGHGGSWLRPR